MSLPAPNVMLAFRRFVGLRSAWRRSLAMEPRDPHLRQPDPEPPVGCPTVPGATHPGCRPRNCHV